MILARRLNGWQAFATVCRAVKAGVELVLAAGDVFAQRDLEFVQNCIAGLPCRCRNAALARASIQPGPQGTAIWSWRPKHVREYRPVALYRLGLLKTT